MAQTTEGATECVKAVKFSFMTPEEVRKRSVVKITNPNLLDSVGRPVPAGLYDPALGPLDEQTPCKTCGQRFSPCPGHCGHMDLVSPVYNPLLFDMLHTILQRTCFFCLRFRAPKSDVEKCISQLELIAKGDIVGAKNLASILTDESVNFEDSDGSSHLSSSTVYSGEQSYNSEHYQKGEDWTSIQFSEAFSVLDSFLRPKVSTCKNEDCKAKNPKINKPTFGWFHMSGMSGIHTRANIIRGCKLGGSFGNGVEEKASSEVVDPYGTDLEINEAYSSDDEKAALKERHKNNSVELAAEFTKQETTFSGPLLPSEVKDIIKLLWENEPRLCSFISDIQQQRLNVSAKTKDYSMFFLEVILVPPIKFRPPTKGGDSVMEHPHTVLLGKILQANVALGNAHVNNTERSKIVNRWMDLQLSVNVFFDSKTAMSQRDGPNGVCQLLEKKEGIFRQKMMGKRVNFACRSVISPDPYLAVNEIGIPPNFALKLTYPEKVTPWNVAKLRNAIINGPDIHPGSTHYADKVSVCKLPKSKKARISVSRKLPSSRGVVAQTGRNGDYDFEGKVVYRHLQDGDIVLVNRQPTLHKPSIMAHVVRVLHGEKTLRMHYANCSSYNADFDGDEMNVHLPQDEISRAEAYEIVNANNQYIVPTRGDTVRGLIQDHIVSAVLLTMKNTFLTLDEFNQLLYGSGVFATGHGSPTGSASRKISVADSEGMVQSVLPAVWKPEPLWTGKQVITAVLNHLTRGYPPFTVRNEAKIPPTYFASTTDKKSSKNKEDRNHDNTENKFLVWKNELVHGVIDKAQFGKYGLVHTVQELYGPNTAGILLSVFSRLFTIFLQTHGFTCGVDDLIILPKSDIERKEKLENEDVGRKVHSEFVKFNHDKIGPVELQLETEKAIRSNGQAATATLDRLMKNKLNEKASEINKELLLNGLLKPFPNNCISLMTISGAKGSSVNFQQISSFLGAQELEGKRVPRMVSGKTLPCFPPWYFSSRAGGFITDRFLSGLRPQEYYFHCMAGREGLVDTAVKTSRSGYLQRCLVKNLECLKVSYDYTVRDADGSIVQFYYGEDGVDAHKTSFLEKFEALETNQELVFQKYHHPHEFNTYIDKLPEKLEKEVEGFIKGKKIHLKRKRREAMRKLMEQKYLSSLAQSGEPVGVIAAQSVGEPSTQMTLNTFHLAGRGDMNVTLGIPRLQEILMTASNDNKTPIMTCPLLRGKTKNDVKALVEKLKNVTIADVTESIEVCLFPSVIHNNQISRVYKLKLRLKEHELVSVEECGETLETHFMRVLEDAIESDLILLSKISGIKHFVAARKSGEMDDALKTDNNNDVDADEDEDDDENGEDFGSDAQKRKKQATDEMDYDDGSEEEDEDDKGGSVRGEEKSGSDDSDDDENEKPEINDFDDEVVVSNDKLGEETKTRSNMKKYVGKKSDRAFFVAADGLNFEAHFRFTKEPHILLGQIAQKAAKKVHIKTSGKLDQIRIVAYDSSDKEVLWENDKNIPQKNQKKPNDNDDNDSSKAWALRTSGVDFPSFWEMEDDLDLKRIYSNNIRAMLDTFGVEAARATIMNEVKHVFGIYGVKIDFRHLSLIADYMTHTGGYRPMNRHGGVAESISPFSKMTFETASKFIVEAASHGMTDHLETPSARICIGLPAKVGTGCFDLMQKLEI